MKILVVVCVLLISGVLAVKLISIPKANSSVNTECIREVAQENAKWVAFAEKIGQDKGPAAKKIVIEHLDRQYEKNLSKCK